MTAKEITLGTCYTDFQPGDRIYGYHSPSPVFSIMLLGTVETVTPSKMVINWDNGENTILALGKDGDLNSQLKSYGKPLNMVDLKPGDIITLWTASKGRIASKIVDYIPNQMLSYSPMDSPSRVTMMKTPEADPTYLERKMALWELEG